MGRVPSAAGFSAARTKLGAGKSGGDSECPGEFWEGAAVDRAINALVGDIIAGMWRTGGYSRLDPDDIPDTPLTAHDVSTPALHLARRQGWKISW